MFRRALSILLCGCVLAGSVPVTGFAAEIQVSETEVTVENAGGGYVDNTPTQPENDADAFDADENADSVNRDNGEKTEITETEGKTTENETVTETQTTEPEDTQAAGNADISEEVREPEMDDKGTVSEVQIEDAEPEVPTEIFTEEINVDETDVNNEEGETVTVNFKDVQEGGYYIVGYVESNDSSYTYYPLYWKEKGTEEYTYKTTYRNGQRFQLFPAKPNTTYVLQLRSDTTDSAQVYDEQEITTSDYKFDVSMAAENVTSDSAQVKVYFTDYKGPYAYEGSTSLYAGTAYSDVQDSLQEEYSRGTIQSSAEIKECTITISLSDLKAGTEYTLPVWVSESDRSEGLKKQIGNITFTTKASAIAEKLKLEASPDETDKTKINYTVSLDTASGTDGLAASYSGNVFYNIKGAPTSEIKNAGSFSLSSSNEYKQEGSLSGLYAGTEYELKAIVDGVMQTYDVSTGANDITPVISLSPLSFGAKMNIELTGIGETTDSYAVYALVKEDDGSWVNLYFKNKTDSSSLGSVNLTSENNYQGEWLLYSSSYLGTGASYDIKVEIRKNNASVINKKYFMLNTQAISLNLGAENIGGRAATITCQVPENDEFFTWSNSSPYIYAYVWYRVKGSESEWEKYDSSISLSRYGSSSVELEDLAVNTQYEVKLASYQDENLIYGTTAFKTTEGSDKGVFGDGLEVTFNGFGISVSNGTYTPSDYADTVKLYLVETDSTGAELAETELYYYKSDKRFSISGSNGLDMKTAKVKIKAVETLEEKDTEGNSIQKEYFSQEYTRGDIPNVTFSLSNIRTGVQKFSADLTYTGDMCLKNSSQYIYAALYYGKTEEELSSSPKTASVYYSKTGSKTQQLTFSGLTAETEYQGKLVVYVAGLGDSYSNPKRVYEQEFTLDNFTTKANATYNLEITFPDARLRELIINTANLGSSATEVTAEQLEKITALSADRSSFDTAAIKDLTGIELLTGLTSLRLENNEVSDASKVDWSKLSALKYLDLVGNDLTTIPDLSKNTALIQAYLNENMISDEEFAAILTKIPDGVSISNRTSSNMSDVQIVQQSQRVGGLQVIAEETYYQRAGKSPLLIKLSGYKTGLPYTFKYFVNENEVTLPQQTGDKILYNTDTGLAVGNYNLVVQIYQKDEQLEEKSIAFEMAEGSTFLEETPSRFSARQTSYSVRTYSDKKPSAAYMQKGSDIIAMALDISSSTSSYEYRYKTLSNSSIYLSGLEVFSSWVSLDPVKNKNPEAGTYDLRLVYEDNSEETLQDVIEIIDKAYVQSGSIGYDYDSTGNYFYLSITGYGFEASKLDYAFTYDGIPQENEYVNARETTTGYIVKFKKSDAWTPKEGDSVQVKVTPKSGYEVVLDNDTFSAYISQGIFYCAYNEVSNKIEVGVTSNLKQENVTFKLERYNSWDDSYYQENVLETIEVTSEIVTETISYLLPIKDNVVYRLPSGCYRLGMTCGDYSDSETFYIYGSETNYWSGQKYVIEGAGDTSFWYNSEIPYVKDNQTEFTAEISGESLTSPLKAGKIWTYSYSDNVFSSVGMTFNLSKLAPGKYTVTVLHNNEKLSTYSFEVIPGDKFVMTNDDSLYASWIDDSSFRVSVDTINTAESDMFTVSLTDIFGNKVEGLTTEVADRYTNSVSLKVTGLKKENAYRYYYIYVTHNKLGDPYKTDRMTKYFTNEKGQYERIYDNDFTFTSTNDRIVGVGMYSDIVFPVTVNVFKPYDTEQVASVVITKNDLKSGTSNPAWYYFKQTLIDELPDQDALYDIVAIDAERKIGTYKTAVLGTQESAAASNWTVSPTQLNLNLDSDATKTGTITVTGNTGTPTFKSENTKVATVAADKTDKNKAVVTAVAEGTTTISVTADKATKSVAVTVTKDPIEPTGITVSAPESASVGEKVEISASVLPAGAWTSQNSITWTSSDTSVISILAGSNGLIVEAEALKTGSATITAALDGTAFTASCTITVVKEISDDEQDEIVKEIGTLYFLEGVDTSLAEIELPDGWSWENLAEKPIADNSHPIQDFVAVYNKDDVSFERYLDVYVSKLESVRITGKSTVNSGKNALYTCAYTYIGADPADGYEINWQWALGQNLAAETKTGERITVTVSGNDTLSVQMTVTNTSTKKSVSLDASLNITAGETADAEPELENKKITIFKNSTQLVPIGLVAKDGNSITAVTAGNIDFKTEQDENGEWLIGLTSSGNDKYTKKSAETLTLTVKTESGKEYEKTLGVTIDVTEITTKNVKFKQTLKPNAAYSDTSTVRAEFNVSSKYIIEDITAVTGGMAEFTVKSYNAATGTLVLEASSNTLDLTTKSYSAKAAVTVRDYGTWQLDLSVAVQNKKPSLKLGDAVVLSGVHADASVALYNGKQEVSCADYTVTKTEGDGATVTKDGSTIKIAYTGEKSGNYKVKVRKNTWASGVELELKGKISVLDPAKAKLAADLSKATININEGYSAPVTINAGIKGSSVSVDLTAAPAKDKDAQAVTAEVVGSGKIRITPKDGAAKGSYKIAVGGSVNGTEIKGMTIAVTLTDKAPEVKLAAKGKIDLANREGTSITYTPSLKNLPEMLSIKSVRMDKNASDSGLFNVKMTDDGKIVMTAVTGKTMNQKTKYKPVLKFTLSNGKTLTTDAKFTVSVTNKLPKITATTLSSALCTSNAGHRASYRLSAGNGYTISNVTTSDTNYKVTFNSSTNTVYVSLSENASVAAGKKYTVPCTVYIKGADNTTKPLTVKLKAVVY